ncbi:MAG: response regulator [Chloroflexi bacterium]|nr:MAG: response regulator [Chloroflexota bacterium]
MLNKKILIVDDDRMILDMLRQTLSRLEPECEVSTVTSGSKALAIIEQQPFDIILVDYMMPGITGVDLVNAVRKISPDTAVILMTAFGTNRLKDTTRIIGVDGYLDKPFNTEELRQIIQQVSMPPAVEMEAGPKDLPYTATSGSIREALDYLLRNSNASTVILLDVTGKAISVAGQISPEEQANIVQFIVDSYTSATRLTDVLKRHQNFKSGNFEWGTFNIYIYNINDQHLLAIIFGDAHKPGVVWFYTRQTANALLPLLQ